MADDEIKVIDILENKNKKRFNRKAFFRIAGSAVVVGAIGYLLIMQNIALKKANDNILELSQSIQSYKNDMASVKTDVSDAINDISKMTKSINDLNQAVIDEQELRKDSDTALSQSIESLHSENQSRIDNVESNLEDIRKDTQDISGKYDELGLYINDQIAGLKSVDTSIYRELYDKVNPSVVRVYVESQMRIAGGSGVIVSDDGYIITCQHVVDGARKLLIYFHDGTECPATVVREDKTKDIAILRFTEHLDHSIPAVFDLDVDYQMGDLSALIGYPQSFLMQGQSTITVGVLSGIREVKDWGTYVQTSAASNGGNSGCPLVTLDGRVIGILDCTITDTENLNFCVPAYDAMAVYDRARGKWTN
jgi:S1-C subfamily serine protease